MDKYLRFFRKSNYGQESVPETSYISNDRKEQYAALLYSLAEGINPITGEEFGEYVLDQPDIIRALYAGANALACKSKTKNKSNRHPKAGEKWTAEDDASLMLEYGNGTSIRKLAKMFGRSDLAIQMRIEKLAEKEGLKEEYRSAEKEDLKEEYKKSAMQNRKIR